MNETMEAVETRRSFFARLFDHLRFPYRHDPLFSVVFFATTFVPLVMFNYLGDGSESPKLFIWIVSTGMALWYIVRVVHVRWRLPKAASILLLLYVVLTIISTIFSYGLLVSVVGWYGRFVSSLLFCCLWTGWIVILSLSLDRQKILFLLKALTVVGVAVAVYGIIQQQGIGYYAGINQQTRSLAPSFLGNPNFSSMFLAGIVPIAATCLLLTPSRRVRYAYAVSIILIVWAIMGFSSRGAIVGVLAGVLTFGVLFLYLQHKRWLYAGLLAFLVVATGFFYTFYVLNRPNTGAELVALSDQTSSFRWLAWNDAMEIIKTRPLTGTGPGQFLTGFRLLGDRALALSERFDDAHNIFLTLGGTVGLPALAIFVGLIAFVVVVSWLRLRQTRDPLLIGLIATIAAVLAAASFNPVTIAVWQLLAFALAALLVLEYQGTEKTMSRWVRWVGSVGTVILLVYAVGFMVADALSYQTFNAYASHRYQQTITFARLTRAFNPALTVPRQYESASRIRLEYDAEGTRQLVEGTERMFRNSADLQRRQAVLYFMLYDKTKSQSDKQGVIDAMNRVGELEPYHATTAATFAYYYYRLDDYPRMLVYLRQALVLNPGDFYSWVLLAKYYQTQNSKPQMLFALDKAYSVNQEILVFKNFIQAVKDSQDITDVYFPVVFPPVAL